MGQRRVHPRGAVQHRASRAARGEPRGGAARHARAPARGRSLAVRLKDNEAVLLGAYRAIAAAVGEGRAITPAAEWLLDNYHLVEEQIREIRDDLPPGYYRQLPKLAAGPFAGYPRVFGLAWAFVAHTDSRFDPEMLRRFVRAYQRVQPLTIGELWAVAITLRIVLVENLRRAARAHRRQPRRAPGGRRAGRPAAGRRTDCRPTGIALLRRHDYDEAALPAAFAVQLVQAAARPGSAGHAGTAVARGAPGGTGHDRRRDRARRAPAAGRDRTSRCATSSPACG